MNYEIIDLEEKTVVGLAARTRNDDPDMTQIIGTLWKDFFQTGKYDAISGKKTGYTLGIYTEYAGTEKDDYTIMTGCEVTSGVPVPEGMVVKTIPAGRYAVFTVTGNAQTAVFDFWQKLWAMKELDRSFICDFEEYRNSDMEHADIRIYIGLKQI